MTRLIDWLRRAETWLDGHGRPAWIAAMVAGFILFWPIGLGILGYMIWSGRMGCGWKRGERAPEMAAAGGNTAFAAYREATIRRLEEEQAAFADYLEKLRRARDQAEFDGFMAERGGPAPQS